jgi:hypothetical protein
MGDVHIGAGRSAHRGHRGGAHLLAQRAAGGHVVGMHVRLEHVAQLESELAHEPHVALHLLEHGVDEQCLVGGVVREQVRVGRGLAVEQLTQQHVDAP